MPSGFDDAAKTAEGYDRYNRGLSNLLNGKHWVHDPSYALAQDPDVYAKVIRDPVVAHALRFRKHLAAGREWRVEPASEESEADAIAAEIVYDLISKIHGFTDARIRLGDAIFRGSSYEYMEGARAFERIAGKPGTWWVPRALKNVDRRRFRLVKDATTKALSWEFWSIEREVWEPLENPEWFARCTFDDTEASLGYGSGLLDTLFRFQALKSQSMQRMGRASERFANGFAIAKLAGADGAPKGGPSSGNQTRASAFMRAFARHRTDDVLAIDADDDLQFVNGLGEGWGILTDSLGYLDTNMVMAVLGSSLATMQSLGEVGSNAKAKEHATSTESISQADRDRLGEDLTRDLVGAVWYQNRWEINERAPGASMPKLAIGQQKQEDPTIAASVIQILLSAGVPLLKSEVYSKTDFTLPGENEAVIEGLPAPAPGGPDLGGF